MFFCEQGWICELFSGVGADLLSSQGARLRAMEVVLQIDNILGQYALVELLLWPIPGLLCQADKRHLYAPGLARQGRLYGEASAHACHQVRCLLRGGWCCRKVQNQIRTVHERIGQVNILISWRTKKKPINLFFGKFRPEKHVVEAVYCAGIKYGTYKNWLHLYNKSSYSTPVEQTILWQSLVCNRDTWTLKRFLIAN